jgi:hypothetical protein
MDLKFGGIEQLCKAPPPAHIRHGNRPGSAANLTGAGGPITIIVAAGYSWCGG